MTGPNRELIEQMGKAEDECGGNPAAGVETAVIGGFQSISPLCAGCGKALLVVNAWMADGCPCNSRLGVNNFNQIRWQLLMELQQMQSRELERMRETVRDVRHALREVL